MKSHILLTALIIAVLMVTGGALAFSWPYLKYRDDEQRLAAEHVERVEVRGFDYLGEDSSDEDVVARFWVRRGYVADMVSLVRYDGRVLREDHPGRDSLSRSRFQEEVGWLPLPGDVRCALTASRILEYNAMFGIDISPEERAAIKDGSITLVEVVVTCGGG